MQHFNFGSSPPENVEDFGDEVPKWKQRLGEVVKQLGV
jgi:hypothetical protein